MENIGGPSPSEVVEQLEFENVRAFEQYLSREVFEHGLAQTESSHCISLGRLRRFYDEKIFLDDNSEDDSEDPTGSYEADLDRVLELEKKIENGTIDKTDRTEEALKLTVPGNLHNAIRGFILAELENFQESDESCMKTTRIDQ